MILSKSQPMPLTTAVTPQSEYIPVTWNLDKLIVSVRVSLKLAIHLNHPRSFKTSHCTAFCPEDSDAITVAGWAWKSWRAPQETAMPSSGWKPWPRSDAESQLHYSSVSGFKIWKFSVPWLDEAIEINTIWESVKCWADSRNYCELHAYESNGLL